MSISIKYIFYKKYIHTIHMYGKKVAPMRWNGRTTAVEYNDDDDKLGKGIRGREGGGGATLRFVKPRVTIQ